MGVTVFGGIVAVNNVMYVPPMDWQTVTTIDELQAQIERAEADDKPLLIDFAAKWCLPCKEMDKLTFHDERVEPLITTRFHLVKVDVTDGTDDHSAMQEAFGSATLPSVLIYAKGSGLREHLPKLREGEAMPAAAVHFKELVDAETFLAEVEPVALQ